MADLMRKETTIMIIARKQNTTSIRMTTLTQVSNNEAHNERIGDQFHLSS